MTYTQAFNLISLLFWTIASVNLAKGFWPVSHKFTVEKKKVVKNGKIIEETPMELVEEGVPEDKIPESIKKIYKGEDLKLYAILLKKSQDLVKLKRFGLRGAISALLACLFGTIAVLVQ